MFTNPYYALVGEVFVVSLFVIEFLFNLRRGFFKSLLHFIIPLFVVIVFSFLLNAFILLPSLKLGGTPLPWQPLQLHSLYKPGRANIKIFDALRLWKWSVESPFSPNLMQISTLILPFIAWFSILLIKRKKMSIRLAIISVISLFLAKGVNEPFGNIYVWLVFNTPLNLFKRSDIWLVPLSLSYSLLCSLFIAENVKLNLHSLRNKLTIMIMLIVIISMPLASQELLTGDASGLLAPAPIPNCYYKVNYWLSRENEEFRTFWLPIYGDLVWMPNPYGLLEQPVGHWVSSKPILTHFNPYQRLFTGIVTKNLGVDEIFEELSGLFSVKYVILHNDTTDVDGFKRLKESVQKTGLIQVYSEDFLYVFYNSKFQPYIRAIQHPIVLIVGGLNFLSSYKNIPGFNLSKSVVVFAEQQLGLGAKILENLTKEDIILIYGKSFNDLLFSCISPNYIYAPLDYLNQNNGWYAETRMELYNYELDYGKGVIFSLTKGEKFNMNIKIDTTAKYQVWIRVYRGDKRGELSLNIDERNIGVIEIPPSPEPKFDWIKCGELNISRGEHKITIINEEGGGVNLIALIPENEVEKTERWISDQILTRQVNVIQISILRDFGWATTSLPSQLWNNSNSLLISDCESSESWSGMLMHVSVSTDCREGSHSLLLERRKGGGRWSWAIYDPKGTWDLTGKDDLSLWIKFNSSYHTISNVLVGLIDKNGKVKQWSIKDLISNEWRLITLNLKYANYYDEPGFNLSQVDKLQINLDTGSDDSASKILIDFIITSNINKILSKTFNYVEESSPILNFMRIGSGASGDEWIVTVNTSKPFILIFSETYHDMWTAHIDNLELEHFPLYYQMNGFFVNKTGTFTIKIEFKLSQLLRLGGCISLITFISIIVFLALHKRLKLSKILN
jgi:hypothetical protein